MKKEIFAGLGLGILIGTIIGLSIAQVTGIILGALTSLLAAFFGLRGSKEGEKGNQMIIGTFSFACVLSVFLGLYIRTHNFFSPSLESEVKEYKTAFFDTSEIKKIILFKQLGLLPEGYSFSKDAIHTNQNSVLMSGDEKSLYLCEAIDENSSLDEIKKSFDNSGGKYSEIEKRLSLVISDTSNLRSTLLFFKSIICEQ
ncbi:MAG: hypothetical protein ABI172_03000 [Ginsengibacter sp.]|jgi:small basic protein